MELAEAVEAWGRANRDDMTRTELEDLADVWRRIVGSRFAAADVEDMSRADATGVMELFDEEQRAEVSGVLNEVRAWVLAETDASIEPDRSGAPDLVPQGPALAASASQASTNGGFAAAIESTSLTPDEPMVIIGSPGEHSGLEAVGATGSPVEPSRSSGRRATGDAPSSVGHRAEAESGQGPVEGWAPAGPGLAAEEPPAWMLPAVVVMGTLALVLWILVLL